MKVFYTDEVANPVNDERFKQMNICYFERTDSKNGR